MKFKKLILVFFILLWRGTIFSQNKTIDSLKLALKNAKHDSVRCEILNLLAETASDDEWPKFNTQLLKLAETKLAEKGNTMRANLFYKKHTAAALNNCGLLLEQAGNPRGAIKELQKALSLFKELSDENSIAICYINIGRAQEDVGDIRNALSSYETALVNLEKQHDSISMAGVLNNIALLFYNQGESESALQYYQKSLKLLEALGDKYGLAKVYNGMGYVYSYKHNYDKTLEYYNKSLVLREELGDKRGLSVALNNIGFLYEMQGDSVGAIDKETAKKMGLKKASGYYQKGLVLAEDANDNNGVATAFNNIGRIFYKSGDIPAALKWTVKGKELSVQLRNTENIMNAASILFGIYKRLGKHQLAFENYELYIQMRDRISNQETKKASIKSQFKYEYEKKEQASKAEQDKKDLLAEEEKQKQNIIRNSFIAGFALVFLLALVVLRSFIQKQKANKQLEEKNNLIAHQKHEVEEKQKEILDSIHYARRIQTALITNEKYIEKHLNKLQSN